MVGRSQRSRVQSSLSQQVCETAGSLEKHSNALNLDVAQLTTVHQGSPAPKAEDMMYGMHSDGMTSSVSSMRRCSCKDGAPANKQQEEEVPKPEDEPQAPKEKSNVS